MLERGTPAIPGMRAEPTEGPGGYEGRSPLKILALQDVQQRSGRI